MKYVHEKIVVIGSVWLIILPYTGFPLGWKKFFTVITGLIFLYIGLLLHKRVTELARSNHTEIRTDTFTETI